MFNVFQTTWFICLYFVLSRLYILTVNIAHDVSPLSCCSTEGGTQAQIPLLFYHAHAVYYFVFFEQSSHLLIAVGYFFLIYR